jgi:cytochrome c oxidase subunit 3
MAKLKKTLIVSGIQRHSYHLVDLSPWPLLSSLNAVGLTVGLVMYMHRIIWGGWLVLASLLCLVAVMGLWWRDVIRESTYLGYHTKKVQQGLKYGVILFIVSEVMFFFAFFWAFFHSSLAPTIEIGSVWPPKGIMVLDTWSLPFLNTIILLTSGATVTAAHHYLRGGKSIYVATYLMHTCVLGVVFTLMQLMEYVQTMFSISDGIYGSTFFMTTGFHGFHVLVGTTFLFVCYLRQRMNQFTSDHHLGFEAAAWYWHFVDVVWLFLFTFVYWWGGL